MSKLDDQQLSLFYEQKRRQYDPLQQRLANEHLLLDRLCKGKNELEYKVLEPENLPPLAYRININGLRSIVGIDDEQMPQFGDQHQLDLQLTVNYPMEPPVCYLSSKIWHPNIQSSPGPFEGRICGNTEGFGTYYTLDELVLRIMSMLAYETYHARMVQPFPEDEDVARWVREIAEPLGIVSSGKGIVADWHRPENWQELIVHEKKIKISMT